MPSPSREPVLIRTAIVAAIAAVLHALIVLGVLPIDPDAETSIASALDLVAAAVAAVWARSGVTPYVPQHGPDAAPMDEADAPQA